MKVSGLSKSVTVGDGILHILQDVSFGVGAGESVAIVGASGSGKSTLLGLLAGLDVPTTGSVAIRGVDVFSLDEDERAALRGDAVGFVFQSFQLLPALTALENVMLPLELSGQDDAREMATQWLERVGLAARKQHYPKHLSGGEQQRVALARAFAPSPQLLLADAIMKVRYSRNSAEVMDLLLGLAQESGTTLILVTHDEALAARCNRILRMHAGRLREETVTA